MLTSKKSRALVIINQWSGNASKVTRSHINQLFAFQYQLDYIYIGHYQKEKISVKYDAYIVCGGDGTLSHVLNDIKDQAVDLFYFPCGTFNEFSAVKRKNKSTGKAEIHEMGCVNQQSFIYVAATGTFTPIGYNTPTKEKKKYKVLAYFLHILKEYQVNHISANILVDDHHYQDEYTLIMIIDANRCFGFPFNRLYQVNDGMFQVLLIKSPKKNNIFGKIGLFPRFFRAFIFGFSHEVETKTIKFISGKKVDITFMKPPIFCIDGEKKSLSTAIHCEVIPIKPKIHIIERKK